jgi:predicted pyridoxine 5'-phosphate oxidase superfamily flavin-nucleotide-binding protein
MEGVMAYGFLDTLKTPSIEAARKANGGDAAWANFVGDRDFDRFTDNEGAFIAQRDSFYMATVAENGWPYMQHRGGPRGFLRVLDDRTMGFADFRGNRQYISVGNLCVNNRVALFLMDYSNRARLKILGHVEIKDLKDDPDLATKLVVPGYKAKIERAMLIHLENFDWNCSQHITPRFTQAELEPALAPIRKRLIDLQQENEILKAQLAKYEQSAPVS